MSAGGGSAKRPKKPVLGFDSIVNRLENVFYGLQSYKPAPATADGNINTAYKQLKTSFTASLKGIATPRQSTPTQRPFGSGASTPSTVMQAQFQRDRPRAICHQQYGND